jgi:hypothetical protein
MESLLPSSTQAFALAICSLDVHEPQCRTQPWFCGYMIRVAGGPFAANASPCRQPLIVLATGAFHSRNGACPSSLWTTGAVKGMHSTMPWPWCGLVNRTGYSDQRRDLNSLEPSTRDPSQTWHQLAAIVRCRVKERMCPRLTSSRPSLVGCPCPNPGHRRRCWNRRCTTSPFQRSPAASRSPAANHRRRTLAWICSR